MKRALVLLAGTLVLFWIGMVGIFLSQPKIIVVPHHNIVAALRARFITQLSHRRFVTRRVFLLSTNHFGKNQHQILTSTQSLQQHNSLSPETVFPFAAAADEVIYADHGIMNLLPDIQSSFPMASVYPLLLGNEVRVTELTNIVTHIQSACSFDCIIIASVDFSHYLPAALSMTHDAYSVQALKNRDSTMAWKAETDSPQVLWLTTTLATTWHSRRWTTWAQTNSSVMIHDPWYESTSHVFGWYQGGSPSPRSEMQSFTIINATASAKLFSLGNRLAYGSDQLQPSCTIPNDAETVVTGWETENTIYIGLLRIVLIPKGYVWRRQFVSLPPLVGCIKKVILLPGTVD